MFGEPIRNAVSGVESRAQIVLPDGFEYASRRNRQRVQPITSGPVQVDFRNSYGQFANLHLYSHGVVRA